MNKQSRCKQVVGVGKWKAKTLFCGDSFNNKVYLTPGFDHDLKMPIPYLAFLLQDGEQNILIDTGINERFLIDGKAWGGAPANCGSKHLIDALDKEGLKPEDIDTVIFTHLHNDHAGNCHLFLHAKMIAQKDEWDNIRNTVFAERIRRDFDFEVIPYLDSCRNFLKIDGDIDLLEGIKLIKTPGHTRGSQSVVVNTTNGTRVFVGDHFHFRCNAFPYLEEIMDAEGKTHKITPAPKDWPTIPSGLVYNFYDYYASADKIKAILPMLDPKYIICGHEAAHMFEEL